MSMGPVSRPRLKPIRLQEICVRDGQVDDRSVIGLADQIETEIRDLGEIAVFAFSGVVVAAVLSFAERQDDLALPLAVQFHAPEFHEAVPVGFFIVALFGIGGELDLASACHDVAEHCPGRSLEFQDQSGIGAGVNGIELLGGSAVLTDRDRQVLECSGDRHIGRSGQIGSFLFFGSLFDQAFVIDGQLIDGAAVSTGKAVGQFEPYINNFVIFGTIFSGSTPR